MQASDQLSGLFDTPLPQPSMQPAQPFPSMLQPAATPTSSATDLMATLGMVNQQMGAQMGGMPVMNSQLGQWQANMVQSQMGAQGQMPQGLGMHLGQMGGNMGGGLGMGQMGMNPQQGMGMGPQMGINPQQGMGIGPQMGMMSQQPVRAAPPVPLQVSKGPRTQEIENLLFLVT